MVLERILHYMKKENIPGSGVIKVKFVMLYKKLVGESTLHHTKK